MSIDKMNEAKDILMNNIQDIPAVIKNHNGDVIYPLDNTKKIFIEQMHRCGESEYYHPESDTYYYKVTIDKDGAILELYIDINTYKNTISSLEIDQTTGILVKKRLFEELKNYFVVAKEQEENFSLALFDIDFFKRVNDNYSHLAGDMVLRNFCDTLKQNVRTKFKVVKGYPFRDKDIVGRFGGEEIVMLLKGISYNDSFEKIESIREQVSCMDTYYEQSIINITCSVGIVHVPYTSLIKLENTDLKGNFLDSVIESADEQLLLAKSSGRNQTKIKTYTR